jgi:thymidylate kinase
MSGYIIVVEGLDGTGKSTASLKLAAALGAHWTTTPCPELRAVRGHFEAAFARSPTARSLAYAASVLAVGADAAHRRASETISVIDRYWLSTVTHAPDAAQQALQALEPLVPAADLTLYLAAPLPIRAARLGSRGAASSHDQATLSVDEDRRLDQRFRALARHPVAGHFVVVDASGTTDATLLAMARAVARWVEPQGTQLGAPGMGCGG